VKNKMKVIAFSGSPQKNGNTVILINRVLDELRKEEIETELVQVGGKTLQGCTACMKCFQNKDQRCVMEDDILNECIEKMLAADGIILGSPTYFANVTTELKALIVRAGLVAMANDYLFKRKVGTAVVAVRRAGAVPAFNAINQFFLINQMIVPGSIYWNLGVGFQPGEVEKDEEGIQTMKNLGENMAWILKKSRS